MRTGKRFKSKPSRHMIQEWTTESRKTETTTAVLKSFLHYIKFPVPKTLIQQEAQNVSSYPVVTLHGIRDILQKLGVTTASYFITLDQLTRANVPSISSMTEMKDGVKTETPIIFLGMIRDEVSYLHPVEGRKHELLSEFSQKWTNLMISVVQIEFRPSEITQGN